MAFTITSEFKVNSATPGQANANLTPLSDGGWVAVWINQNQNSSSIGLVQQRYGSDSRPVGEMTQVNADGGSSYSPHVTALKGGGWVVSWEKWTGTDYDIHQQRFAADGAKVQQSTTVVNATTAGDQSNSTIVGLEDGGWLVSWQGPDPLTNREAIYMQRYSSAGSLVGGETQISPSTSENRYQPCMTALSDGGWIATWVAPDTNSEGIFQQRFSAAGIGSAVSHVEATDAGGSLRPSTAVLADHGWITTWLSQATGRPEVHFRRFAADGTATDEVAATASGTYHDKVQVAALADGGWILTWASFAQKIAEADTYQQRYDALGQKVGPEVLVNSVTQGSQLPTDVIGLADGSWLVAWNSVTDPASSSVPSANLSRIIPPENGLRPGAEYASGTDANETLSVVAGGLDAGDRVLGGGGTDTLLMSGPGTLDLTAPASFAGFEILTGSAGDDTIIADAARLNGLTSIDGKAGSNTLLLAGGCSFDLRSSATAVTGFDLISLTDPDGTSVAANDWTTASLLRAAIGRADSLAIENLVLSRQQRATLFANGFEVVKDKAGTSTAPTDIKLTGGAVTEHAAVGDIVARLTTTDADTGENHTYTIVANAAGDPLPATGSLFAITGDTITVRTALDDVDVGSHDLWVKSEDAAGASVIKKLTVSITNVAEAPTDITLTGGVATEHAAVGDIVARLTTKDPDTGENHTYTIVANAAGDPLPATGSLFAITGDTITVRTALDAGDVGSHDLWVKSEDAAGASVIKKLTLSITDVADAPTDITLTGGVATEHAAVGAIVARLTTKDPDTGENHTYTIVANAAGDPLPATGSLFAITGDTITVRTALDAGDVGSHDLWVKSEDAAGASVIKKLTVSITDVADAPTEFTANGLTVDELAAPGTAVGKFSSKDPDAGDKATYTLTDDAGGRFALIGDQIVVKNGFLLDFEQAASHSITARATDASGLTLERTFVINVGDVGVEVTAGSDAADVFIAGAGADKLSGAAGDDVLKGGAGADSLNGGSGNDRLYGGLGNDMLTGGAGRDVFVLDTKPSKAANRDKVADFSVKDDTIWLDNAIFRKLGQGSEAKPGKLKKGFFALDKAQDADDFLAYSKTTGIVTYDVDGSGSGKAIEILVLKKGLALTSADFLII